MQNDINSFVEKLKKTKNKKKCLETVYKIMIEKYHGNRIKTVTQLFKLFNLNIDNLWAINGFLHCTSINYLVSYILLKTGLFSEEDIRTKWTLIWFFSPHQYLQVKLNDKFINIDIWAYIYGVKYGDYAHGFNQKIWIKK